MIHSPGVRPQVRLHVHSPSHSALTFGTMTGARRGLNEGSAVRASPASRSSSTTSSAMAGEPAIPGLSIPAALTKLPSADERAMIQSPALDLARAPEKEWNASSTSNEGTSDLHAERMV